jgi:HEAT repeat protein
MRFTKILGLVLVFAALSLVFAGGGIVPKKEDVPKYLKQLQSSTSAAERAKAAEMLGKRGGINVADVDDAIDPLKKAFEKDKDAKVRAASARALGDIRPDPETTVPLLIDRLKNDTVMDVKMATVVALGQYGADAKDAIQPLRDLLKKFDAKKSKEGQTIQNTLTIIQQKPKKKG